MAKYSVAVDLVGEDGNAYAILGRVQKALSNAGVEKSERDLYFTEATAGDYDHLLRVTMDWVEAN